MKWFVSATVHNLQISALNVRIAQLLEERDYWRTRAERLMDSALARAGAISEPTMREAVVTRDPSAAATMIAALSITEIGTRAEEGSS